MMITRTAKLRILPDQEEKELLLETMHVYKDACNYVSLFIYSTHEMSLKVLQEKLYYKIRDKFNKRSQMAISVLRTVRSRYNILESNNHPWKLIRFNKPHIDLVWNRDYSLLGNAFSINTLKGRKKIAFSYSKTPLDGKMGTADIVFKHGKFFLNVPVTLEITDEGLSNITNVVGVDRGIRFIATTYDTKGETQFFSGKQVNHRKSHFTGIIQQLKHVGTSSSRRRLKRVLQREHRWMQDVNHCISKALTEAHPSGTLFVLEDLKGIFARTKKITLNYQFNYSSWSYYDLEQKIIYKATLRGQKVIKVSPAYTSQTCPLCGRRNRNSRNRRKHVFRCCSCRYKSNDDRVAAINLYNKGMKYLIQSGESMPLFGGAQSNVPDATLKFPFEN